MSASSPNWFRAKERCVCLAKLCAQSLWWNSICRSIERNCQQTDWGVKIQSLCCLPNNNELFGWYHIEIIGYRNSRVCAPPLCPILFFAFPNQFKYLMLFYVIDYSWRTWHRFNAFHLARQHQMLNFNQSNIVKSSDSKKKKQTCGMGEKRMESWLVYVSFLNLVSFFPHHLYLFNLRIFLCSLFSLWNLLVHPIHLYSTNSGELISLIYPHFKCMRYKMNWISFEL